MKNATMLTILVLTAGLVGQVMGAIGIFDGSLDLGRPATDSWRPDTDPRLPGIAVFGGGVYTVTGGGSDWWDGGEYGHFVHKRLAGDFRIEADVLWQGLPDAGNGWKKAGVAIRNDIDTGAGNEKEVNFIVAATRPNMNRGSFQFRLDAAASMGNTDMGDGQPMRVALQRCYDSDGDAFVEGFVDLGGGWERVDGRWAFNLNNIVYAGLFVTSHDYWVTETAVFTNVQFVNPVYPAEFPRKPGSPVRDPERVGPVVGGWGVLEVVDNGNMGSIADAVASIESGAGNRLMYNLMGPLNINDHEGNAKNFGGDRGYGVAYENMAVGAPWPAPGSVNDIALLARGQVDIPVSDFWSFYINSDDGDELSVDNGALVIGSEGWNTNSFGTVWLTAGPHNIQVVHREDGGGANLEIAAAKGATTDLSNFRIIGSGDPGLPEMLSIVPRLLNDLTISQSFPEESGPITNLSQAVQAYDESVRNETDSKIVDIMVNHSDPDDRGGGHNAFGGDHDNPYDQHWLASTKDDDFAVVAKGTISIKTPGTYYIGYNSDDGAWLQITGATWLSICPGSNANAVIVNDQLSTDVLTGWSWTVGEVYLSAGDWPFNLIMFERDRGAFVELFGGSILGSYGLLMSGPDQTVVKPAVADALNLVFDEPWCLRPIPGDLNDDCKNDFFDIAISCSHWLECNRVPDNHCHKP